MPKQKRWEIKRRLDQCIGHLDNAVEDIVAVGAMFGTEKEKLQQLPDFTTNNMLQMAYDDLDKIFLNLSQIMSVIDIVKTTVKQQRDNI